MSVQSKTRLISFRVTEQEYERFLELCLANGTRNASALARAAVHSLLERPASASSDLLQDRLARVEGRLDSLLLEVRRLDQRYVSEDMTPGE